MDSPFKTCSGTNRQKFEAECWLLFRTCQTGKDMSFCQADPALLEKKHTTGAQDLGLLPSCTGHSQEGCRT